MTRPRRAKVARALVLLLFTLAGCGRRGPKSEQATTASLAPSAPAAPAAVSSTAPSPSSTLSDAPVTMGETLKPPSVAKPGTPAEEASAALEAAAMERLVFREILAGGYTFNWRRTWILHRSEKTARLDVICQMGVAYLPLGGKEDDEGAWKEPVLMRYAGTREGKDTVRLALTSGTPGKFECAWMPETIVLSCRPEPVAVLRAGAALVLDNASAGVFHWAPSTAERVTGLRCEGLTNARFQWPLVFVAPKGRAPGIEWAFLHDDAVQQGAHRWMPAFE